MQPYLYNAPHATTRLTDAERDRAEKVAAAWEPIAELPEEFNGNLGWTLSVNRATLKAESGGAMDRLETHAPLFEAIPSALGLYRLLCLFPSTVHSPGPAGYKLVWQVGLRHKRTSAPVVFGEWKGGFEVFSEGKLPTSAMRDLLKLLTLLCGPKCPHPYDGTVAGTVA